MEIELISVSMKIKTAATDLVRMNKGPVHQKHHISTSKHYKSTLQTQWKIQFVLVIFLINRI